MFLVQWDRNFFSCFFDCVGWCFVFFFSLLGGCGSCGSSNAEHRGMLDCSQQGFLPYQNSCMQLTASVHTHKHTQSPPSSLPPQPKWQKISRINLAAKPLSLEHTNCHSFPITKKWGVAQFAGVHFEQGEDGKLTARLQIYGRVICPDADVLVAAFSLRNRKQGSHLKTTDVVFSWQLFFKFAI